MPGGPTETRARKGRTRPAGGRQAGRDRISHDSDDLVFRAIANADRRVILDAIHAGAKTTGELCEILDHLDRCTVMLHLNVLEEAGLVIVRREGRQRWNHLDVTPIQAIYSRWIKSYAAPAAELLLRLKRELG